jgi:chromate transporter
MRTAGAPLEEVLVFFLSLSLVAFGGVGAVLPELRRRGVDVEHWLTDTEFAELYALAQATPGPPIIIVTLMGLRAAGYAGALVATAATILPTSLLVFVVARMWDRFAGSEWRNVIQQGLAPITAGLLAASAFVLVRTVDRSVASVLITATVAVVATRTRIDPLSVFVVAAVLGFLGLVG